METLAYTHLYEAREVVNLDPEAYELKLLEGVNWKQIPNSAWIGLLGIAVLLSSLSPMLPASALRANPPGGCLNARSGPGTRFRSDMCVRKGATLKPVVARSGSWLQLSSGRWVYGPYTTAGGGSVSGGGGGGGGSSYPSRVLQRGSRGTAVANVQARLRDRGYFYGPVTGYYGSLTSTAVRNFQSANGIRVDGVVGPQTRGYLY